MEGIMSDLAIKKRMERAKQKAEGDLRSFGYEVIVANNRPICLVALRESEVRVIKICIGQIDPQDRQAVGKIQVSANVTKEIWLRRPGEERFEIQKL